jgi:hypothetical protein
VIDIMIRRKDEGPPVIGTLHQCKRGGSNVHFPVADKNVTVASKSSEALISVNIGVVGIQKTSMTNYKIEYWIPIAVRINRISPENVVDLASIVFAQRNLAIAIVVSFAARVA